MCSFQAGHFQRINFPFQFSRSGDEWKPKGYAEEEVQKMDIDKR